MLSATSFNARTSLSSNAYLEVNYLSFFNLEVKYLIFVTLKLSVGLFFFFFILVTLKLSTLAHGNELRNN